VAPATPNVRRIIRLCRLHEMARKGGFRMCGSSSNVRVLRGYFRCRSTDSWADPRVNGPWRATLVLPTPEVGSKSGDGCGPSKEKEKKTPTSSPGKPWARKELIVFALCYYSLSLSLSLIDLSTSLSGTTHTHTHTHTYTHALAQL
jgi:hypothetical protein